MHQQQHMVYLRVSLVVSLRKATLYQDNVQGREATRHWKFIQFSRKKLSYCEPALRVYHRHRDFDRGIVLALHHEPDRLALLAMEAALIQDVRPELNHPWVLDTLKRLRIKPQRCRLSKTGLRFIRKATALVRKRRGVYHQRIMGNRSVFLSLYRLGSDSVKKFEESRLLRSHVTPLQALYLRCRLLSRIDEPFRTRSGKQLRLILAFRKGQQPPTNVPLRLPPLTHDLVGEVQRILRFIVTTERVNFPPLHLPSVKMVEIKARCWHRSAFNFRSFLRLWTPGKPHECTCQKWCHTPSTHLFAPVRQILPVSPLANLNLNDTTFLPAKQWQRIAEKEVRKWCTRWKLPDRILQGLLQWVQQQLVLHHEALQADQQDLPRQISQDLSTLTGLVLTPADHFPNSLHVACPFAFHVLLDTAFLDSSVFERCIVGVSSMLANLKSRFLSLGQIYRRYHWGCNWSLSLPIACILPKPSKDFRKARPIIACDRCWHARLTTFLATGLFQIMSVVFPAGATFNVQSVQQAIRATWRSMMNYPATEPVAMVQKDLIGFFKSVPHSRILQALDFSLMLLQDRWGQQWQKQSVQVSLRNKDPHLRVFRGQRRFAARQTKTLHLEDRPTLVEFLLRSSFFQCGFHFSTNTRCQNGLCPCSCSVYPGGFHHGVYLAAQFSCIYAEHRTVYCHAVC